MGISRITRNCQITLPRDIRRVVGIKEGDEIMFSVENNKIILTKMDEDPVLAAAGIWKDVKETGAQYQKRMREQWKGRAKKLNW